MSYTYKMVQLAPNIVVMKKNEKGSEAAQYLEEVVNAVAADGWEFLRIDSFGVHNPPGCLNGTTGKDGDTTIYHVATFRKPAG